MLREFASLTPEQYFQVVTQIEKDTLAKLAQSSLGGMPSFNTWDAEVRLRSSLARFYEIGAQLYGVRLDADDFAIVPSRDLNAVASGSRILFNAGLLQYFLQPQGYVAEMLGWQYGGYTRAQYDWLRSTFTWQNDWDSIHFVLAHEAAHNLMRHRDERILGVVQEMFADYQRTVLDYRKDLAHGRTGGGVKRYLWQSLQNFAGAFQKAEKTRAEEAEADVVAMLILRRAGLNPAIATTAAHRMAMLLGGPQIHGWQAGMTQALCSTHPDWMKRIQNMQANLNCLQFTGNICQQHRTYPVEDFLRQMQDGMDQLTAYHQKTLRIAEADTEDGTGQVQIEVDPKDARLTVNGEPAGPGKLRLPIGPATLEAYKEGYESTMLRVVVFPDVEPKLKLKLRRTRR